MRTLTASLLAVSACAETYNLVHSGTKMTNINLNTGETSDFTVNGHSITLTITDNGINADGHESEKWCIAATAPNSESDSVTYFMMQWSDGADNGLFAKRD